jgi:hypothetical protein
MLTPGGGGGGRAPEKLILGTRGGGGHLGTMLDLILSGTGG